MKARSSSGSAAIPEKLYFKIGEVSKIAGVPTHVLRFWESEFPKVAPRRTASGQRLYTPKEVELVLQIKTLLYEQRFTIDGARQYLRSRSDEAPPVAGQLLVEIRAELEQLRRLLE
jgi:DNA-binding transcriptional MerR regulator